MGPNGQTYLEDSGDFVLPSKIYDFDKEFRNIVLISHIAETKNTGVLLNGFKGNGKSVCAMQLAIESNLPIIVIDRPILKGVDFVSLLNSIEQEFVLFIDEFEKLFASYTSGDDESDYHTQDSFLSLMDGALSNEYKKLFIFTTNNSVNDKFLNRPSRIKWHKEYQFMLIEMYNELIDDKLEKKEYKEDLLRNLPIQEATVDLLSTIISQINVLDMPYSAFKKVFNHHASKIEYEISGQIDGDGEWVDLGVTAITSCPVRETRYIGNLYVNEMMEVEENACVFKSNHTFDAFNKIKRLKKKIEDASFFIYKLKKVESFVEKYIF